MSNNYHAHLITASAGTGATAAVAWITVLDVYLRVGASAVAIISGIIVAWVAWKNRNK